MTTTHLDHHHDLEHEAEPTAHRFDRWILTDGRTVTARCSCGQEYSDGGRHHRGNPNEVLARLQQHARDADTTRSEP